MGEKFYHIIRIDKKELGTSQLTKKQTLDNITKDLKILQRLERMH